MASDYVRDGLDYVRDGLDYVRGAFNNEAQGTIYVRDGF